MNTYAATPSTPNDQSPSKRKDLSNLLGLNDQGPGTPSRQVAQMVALQNLPNVAPEITTLSPSKKDLNKFLGIEQSKRARPQSLAMGSDGSPHSARQMKLNQLKALNKTLSRLTSNSSMAAQSAPTTPDNYPYSILHCDENLSPLKKKNLHKFLGLPPPPPPIPPPRTASSTKRRATQDSPPSMLKMTSALSSSTPDDLEKENAAAVVDELRRISQSNDGLATPGSCTTPAKGPAMTPQPFCSTVVPVVGPKPSNSMFSLATASNSLPRPQFQPARPAVHMRPNQFSCSLQRGATIIHGHNNINHFQRLPPRQPLNVPQSRTLPRSSTLDDMEPVAAVNWVQRPASSGVRRHSSLLQPKSILKDSQNNPSARRSRSSASSAYFTPGPAPNWPPPPQSCSCRVEAQAQQAIHDPIYVTMGPNPNRQEHRHSIGVGYVPPTVLTLNPPPTNKATTTVVVNGGDYLDMNDVRVKTTAIVHNEPAMFCNNTSNHKTVVQIRGEGEGAVSRMESELEETI